MVTHPFRAAFERCEDWLSKALARGGEHTLDHVLTKIMAGQAQIWEGESAVIVTEITEKPEGRVIHIWLGAGRLDPLLALVPGVEAFGRAWGCAAIELEGRRGWHRVMGRLGYHGDTVLRKALTNG